ncbi:hypothetical protein KI387_001474 [Taxus chinensis]|uniref:DEUBAD domain-containing protein n=1 Tax=Taxus chinensis TaxID=29808 RepID=A0AA38GW20_TAXCH|nr:hypothetical protein KI387_001474 [Taxus chinensis]
MAAGQQMRPLNRIHDVSNNGVLEFCSEKMKINLELSKWFQTMRPHIALEWDDNQRKAVAQKEQVGVTWRHLLPFQDPSSCHSCVDLADVFIVPKELYELKDLKDVLTYEAWHTCFSDSERKLLSEFLPKGLDAEEVIQSLLIGHNLHFGNPFIVWGLLLCSGGMHPDVVRLREVELRASKKAYYSELQKYHNNMLETLQRWKEAWKSCENPEREFPQSIWKGSQMNDDAKMDVMTKGGNMVVSNPKKQDKLHATFKESSEEMLREHWLFLVLRDLPVAYSTFVEGHLQRHLQRSNLQKEILERQKFVLDKVKCKENLIDSMNICNTTEGAQAKKKMDLSPINNLSGHVFAEIEEVEKSEVDFTKSYSQSNIEHAASEPFDSEEPSVEIALSTTKSLPVQISSVHWSPCLKMIPQLTKYEEHGSCLSGIENPQPGENVSPNSRLKQSSDCSDEQPIRICKDDVLSSIKETLSTTYADSPEFSSHCAFGSTGKESSDFLRRKRSILWTRSLLTGETSVDDSIRRNIVREEPEKRPCFGIEKPGTLQNVAYYQSHFSPQRDQSAKNQSCSFLVQKDKKAGIESHILHVKQPLTAENPTGEPEIHPFNNRQGHLETQILSLSRDHPSHLSLGHPQQSDNNYHFKLDTQIFQEQQRKISPCSPFSGDLTKIANLPDMKSDETHSLFLSSCNDIQARGRQPSLNHEINQAGNNCSLPCCSVSGQTQQGFQHASHSTQELQFFTNKKSKEHDHQLQHRDSMQSGKQECLNDHLQEQHIFKENHHQENQHFLFQHSGQNQSLQSSWQQDLFLPGLSPAVLSNWNVSPQAVPCRPLPGTAMQQLETYAGHRNGSNNQFHASWSPPEFLQRPSVTAHGHAGSSGERKLFGSLPQWDGSLRSTYGILNHDQYGNMKNYTSIGCFTSNNGHGKDDWIQFEHSHANPPYGRPHETGSAYAHIPCINISPTSYPNSQIALFRQQSSDLQNINGQGLSLRSPWSL